MRNHFSFTWDNIVRQGGECVVKFSLTKLYKPSKCDVTALQSGYPLRRVSIIKFERAKFSSDQSEATPEIQGKTFVSRQLLFSLADSLTSQMRAAKSLKKEKKAEILYCKLQEIIQKCYGDNKIPSEDRKKFTKTKKTMT